MHTSASPQMLRGTRPAAVAGLFYPDDARELRTSIITWLSAVDVTGPTPKALIVPHAGYDYSGPIAASGYAHLRDAADQIRTVVLLGPAHREVVDGLAAPTSAAFETPLGSVPVDQPRLLQASHLRQVVFRDDAHVREHSLEVHLPFLQVLLSDFRLVPLAVGRASAEEVAEVLRLLWDGPETLIVVSSDLSHYLDAETARHVDQRTAQLIERGDVERITGKRACGYAAIQGLLIVARDYGLQVRAVDLRNSSDTSGSRDRVVGYGAFVVEQRESAEDAEASWPREAPAAGPLTEEERHTLWALAEAAIRRSVRTGELPEIDVGDLPELAQRKQAAFVTLRRDGELRGCMGSLNWDEPVAASVISSAFKAANRDPRFAALTEAELTGLQVDVSVLSAATPLTFASESELLEQLRPGIDGVILRKGSRYGVFLPSVWESLPEPASFLRRLKQKAGLPEDYWSDTLTAERFEVESIRGFMK